MSVDEDVVDLQIAVDEHRAPRPESELGDPAVACDHGRYFSPLNPNRPTDLTSLFAQNDVVLYDRATDPDEINNIAVDPTQHDLVAEYSAKLERLISEEIGEDRDTWVLERPNLVGWPPWRGDNAA